MPPTRPYTRRTPPDLLRQTPPRPRARSMPHELQTSSPPFYTLAAGLPSSRAPYRHVATSARLQPVSIPPYLLISTPTACLRSSRALAANTSTSLRRQRASRAPPPPPPPP